MLNAFVPNMDEHEGVVIGRCNMVQGPPDGMRAVLVPVNGHSGGLDQHRYLRAVIGREVVNH